MLESVPASGPFVDSQRARKKQLVGALFVIASGLGFSTKAILAKLAYRLQIDALSVLTLRMFFSAPFLVASALHAQTQATSRISRRDMAYLLLLGFVGYYLSSFMDFKGLEYISASLERLVLFAYPTLVVLISALLFHVKLKRAQLWALLLTYLGIFLVFASEFGFAGSNVLLGSSLVFGCAVTYAGYLVGAGRLIPKIGAQRFNSISLLIATLGVGLHWGISGKSLLHLPLLAYVYGFLMALIATVIPTFLLAKGIGLVGSGTAAILSTIGPISTIALAHFVLAEPVTWVQVCGSVLVLLGVTLLVLPTPFRRLTR